MHDRTVPSLPYDFSALPRERARHYIPATEQDIQAMLAALGLQHLDDLFRHLPTAVRMATAPALPEELGYEDLYEHMRAQSQKKIGFPTPPFSVMGYRTIGYTTSSRLSQTYASC